MTTLMWIRKSDSYDEWGGKAMGSMQTLHETSKVPLFLFISFLETYNFSLLGFLHLNFCMKVLFWNYNEVVSKSFLRTLKDFLGNFKPMILCIAKPKCSGHRANRICSNLSSVIELELKPLATTEVSRCFRRIIFNWKF